MPDEKVLIIGSGSPKHLRRPFVAHRQEDELFTSPQVADEPGCAYRPGKHFNISEYLRMLPEPWRKPTLLVTCFGVGDFVPQGLSAVKCPKVLLVSDTHHGKDALRSAVQVACGEPYDLVVLQYTPQHERWFREAGVRDVVTIPCFGIKPFDLYAQGRIREISDVQPKRTRGVTFVGSVGQYHPYRAHVFNELHKAGINVEVHSGTTQEEAAKIHSESVVSLNISLNADFNLRNFEVLAAGGCLVTDVMMMSGEGVCHTWFEIEHISKYCHKLLHNPEQALAMAQRGYDWYWKNFSPVHQIDRLHAAVALALANKEPAPSPTPDVVQRIHSYEAAQELARTGRLGRFLQDIEGLPRRDFA